MVEWIIFIAISIIIGVSQRIRVFNPIFNDKISVILSKHSPCIIVEVISISLANVGSFVKLTWCNFNKTVLKTAIMIILDKKWIESSNFWSHFWLYQKHYYREEPDQETVESFTICINDKWTYKALSCYNDNSKKEGVACNLWNFTKLSGKLSLTLTHIYNFQTFCAILTRITWVIKGLRVGS